MVYDGYLLKFRSDIGKHICISGVGSIINKLYNEIKKNYEDSNVKLIENELYISNRLLYFWMYNKRPISIEKLEKFIKLWSRICNKTLVDELRIFKEIERNITFFSISGGNKIFLPKEINEKCAYLMGYLSGDGYLANPFTYYSKRKKLNCVISFSDQSKEFLESVIKPYLYSLFKINVEVKRSKKTNSYFITFNSKILHTYLTNVIGFKFGAKGDNYSIPSKIFNSNIKINLIYIRGLFDADGTIFLHNKNIIIALRQKSKRILDEIKNILHNENIYCTGPYLDIAASTYLLQIKNKESILNFKNKVGFDYPSKRDIINNHSPMV